jgi:peptidoglycan-N-acetylglucosamine deacetylase
MSISTIHSDLGSHRLSRKTNKLVVCILLLSSFLLMLGSISLTGLSYWKKTTSPLHPKTSVTLHNIRRVPTHTPIPQSTTSSTQAIVHTPLLNSPLFNGNTHIPEIALTFDDGPNPYYTPQILAILQKYGVRATFFDVGYLVADYPNIVRMEYDQQNVVANHSWSHPVLTNLSAQEIQSQLTSTTNSIQAAIGVRPTFFRPPYGAVNSTVLAQASNLHYTTVMWDGSAEDWSLPGTKAIVSKTLSYARNGAILLLHDGGGNREQTVVALPIIITTLKSRGFKFVTIQQLVDDLVAPQAQKKNKTSQYKNSTVLNHGEAFTSSKLLTIVVLVLVVYLVFRLTLMSFGRRK